MRNEVDYTDNFFEKLEIPFDTDKSAVWVALDQKISNPAMKSAQLKMVRMLWVKLAAAAVALLIASTFFLRFYTEKVECLNGQRISHVLPDGSVVNLNASSALSYNPHWWWFLREVKFSGEAFFTVEKGHKFSIISAQGVTQILGTSFNIFARESDYKVFCKTGKVKVTGIQDNFGLEIVPGEMAVFNEQITSGEVQNAKADHVLAWQNATFNFNSLPLNKVLKEIERQYNVKITLQVKNPHRLIYTGHFKKGASVEVSLNYICKSFNLKYRKVAKGQYSVFAK